MSPPLTCEGLLIAYLNATLTGGVRAFGDVPAARPESFVTVERTGGGCGRHWHTSRAKAAALGEQVAALLVQAPAHVPRLAATGVQSVYNLPDPDSGQARYQLTATATIY